jgi:hypothetical protein
LQRSEKFLEEMGKGLRLQVHLERRPPNPKQEGKSYYEKSKDSVQTHSRTSDPAAPGLLFSSVYLGTKFSVSSRPSAV